ncbi:DUF389 domain-containing protein [Salinimicrobium sediminilitoris]|uniref:DUF389 domain-containing protein n=1 Tax=Salinimicrobium sediminilitoris TaxID=2876715 RepID=UPI001E64BFB2|nr:DUF389 domain-containing protein [Salinimicrobium sediminilitoris]MCC8360878.1 DUF389 domain-containing protein [Salinimicrobium sediminilitoris]
MENNSGSNTISPSGEENKGRTVLKEIKEFLRELLDIHDDTDRETTLEIVKRDISFKGHNAWILIFSIFVASIGLNVSSTAVVIGAMLISPLMGPIVGIGFSVAINDIDTLKRSLVNLGVMVVLSVLTAYLYFLISPIKEETPELVARTYPTILDVLVAIFGGMALIVAKTKKGAIASVIMGVAIATALMPPLCTVGYGLATAQWNYAGGALYLFSINSVFIALSTFLVAKLLRFPLVKYVNSRHRRNTARLASLIAILVMIPSIILFVNLLREQVFVSKTKEFVDEVINYPGAEVFKFEQNYKTKIIEVYLIGRTVPQEQIAEWVEQIKEKPNLEDVVLEIYQGSDQSSEMASRLSSQVRAGILEDLYVRNQQLVEDKDARIQLLEQELVKYRSTGIPFEAISKEARINYSGIQEMSYANNLVTNFSKIDTIPTFNVRWSSNLSPAARRAEMNKLEQWLQLRLALDTLVVRTVN